MAPFSTRYSRVGIAARMRVSSVMTPSLRGTLRSQRTNTTLPSRSAFLRSPTDFFAASTLNAALGAFAETLEALTEDLAKNALEESAGAAAVKAAIVSVVDGRWRVCGIVTKSRFGTANTREIDGDEGAVRSLRGANWHDGFFANCSLFQD